MVLVLTPLQLSVWPAGSITGGAGNDSIVMGTAATLGWTSNGTINGGAGVDTIILQGSAGAGLSATSGLATGIASVAYAAGDIIRIDFNAGGTQAVGGTVNVGSSAAGGLTASPFRSSQWRSVCLE